MKIAVCVNHVPDTETKVRVGPDGRTIDRAGVNFIINPYDEFAVEAALRLKEKFGGETVAVSLGADANKESLRKALAMGIDRAVLLKDESVRDSYSVAFALAAELRALSPDCVLFGKGSIDYADEQVPGLVAEFLGMPSVSCVVKLEAEGSTVSCEREIEGGRETVQAAFPLVISAQKGLNEPRYPALRNIIAAKAKPIEEKQPAPMPPKVEVVGMRMPPPKKAGRIIGTDAAAAPELVRLLREEAKVF